MTTIADVERGPFVWRESGPDTDHQRRTTLLLLHGLGGSRLSWEPQLLGLGSERRVVAWDMPGYGASAALDGDVTFATLADAVADFVDALGEDAVDVAGISFGGMIAQYFAAKHPNRVRSLALLSTSPAFGLDGTKPDEWRAAVACRSMPVVNPSTSPTTCSTRFAGPEITVQAMADQRAAMARVSGAALRRSIDCLVTHDSRDVLPSITAPTLCMVGELDEETPFVYAFALADLIPHARLVVIPRAGHLLNAEAPDAVNQLLREHIERAATEGVAR